MVLFLQGCEVVQLWSSITQKVTPLQTGFASPCFMAWAKKSPLLAIGTQKGALLIYNKLTYQKIPIVGKHSKAIVCGAWSANDVLALGAADRSFSLSNASGETLLEEELKYEPVSVSFANSPEDVESGQRDSIVSVNVGRKMILLYSSTQQNASPVVVGFQNKTKYGAIVEYEWCDSGQMIVSFENGQLVAISTRTNELVEELQSVCVQRGSLRSMAYSNSMNQIATCGSDGLCVMDLSSWQEQKDVSQVPSMYGSAETVQWTADGRILTVGTTAGTVICYLMSMPQLTAYNGSNIAYLSSLRQISIVQPNIKALAATTTQVDISVEPSFLSLGAGVVAVGVNNHAWFYDIGQNSVLHEQEYNGSVQQMCVNSRWAAALCEGRVFVHSLSQSAADTFQTFPQSGQNQVQCVAMTENVLFLATDGGTIESFYITDDNRVVPIGEFRHAQPIERIFSNPLGTRVLCIDITGAALLLNPVDQSSLPIEKFPKSVDNILWDVCDKTIFIAVDTRAKRMLTTYLYRPYTLRGPGITQVSITKLSEAMTPVLCNDGVIHGQRQNGSMSHIVLSSHEAFHRDMTMHNHHPGDKTRHLIMQHLALGHIHDAWTTCRRHNSREHMSTIGRKALEHLELNVALDVYRELGNAAMSSALEALVPIEDVSLLAGHVCMLIGDFDAAQTMFLESSQPQAALQMRRDLLHWDHALKLADSLCRDVVGEICQEYAQQLEFTGEFSKALDMYERALAAPVGKDSQQETSNTAGVPSQSSLSLFSDGSNADFKGAAFRMHSRIPEAEHRRICQHGIARMLLRVGQLQRGKSLALQMGATDKKLLRDCGNILEHQSHYADAAQLFIAAEAYEKAVTIYLNVKDYANATPLMKRITTPKLHSMFARAREAEGKYLEAAQSYQRAKDFDNVVRVHLEYLNNVELACQMVRNSGSNDGAALVASYCSRNGMYSQAVEFLLLAKRVSDAFQLSEQHNEMDTFAQLIGDNGSSEQYQNIAVYYESTKKYGVAGEFCIRCNDWPRALKLFLQAGDDRIKDAIDLVARARREKKQHSGKLIRMLHGFLLGELDGKPKDPQFIFDLYVAIEEYGKAGETAMTIAHEEQQLGHYKPASRILLSAFQTLRQHRVRLPEALMRNLMLLHMYSLVKVRALVSDDQGAARLLMRLVDNISKFPANAVPLLLSALIGCDKANLKRSSYEYAAMLMRKEYREKLGARRSKVETMVRKRNPNASQAEDAMSPCAFCEFKFPSHNLDCPSCRNTVPFCIATGRHMCLDDWSMCPGCDLPALHSEFSTVLDKMQKCPMCSTALDSGSIHRFSYAKAKQTLLRLAQADSTEEETAETDRQDDHKGTNGAVSNAAGFKVHESTNDASDEPPARQLSAFGVKQSNLV
jgi:WD repeat-containing protein 19